MLKRLPIIRHVRYFWHAFWFSRFLRQCQRSGLGWFPQESDVQHLQDIWDGRA